MNGCVSNARSCRKAQWTPGAARLAKISVVLTVAALAAASTGCTGLSRWAQQGFQVGPDYCRPPAPVADNWIDYENPSVASESVDYSCWWYIFDDPMLDQLVDKASQQNLTLQGAGMRILEARARLGIARGNLLPQSQQAFGDFARINTSTTAANVVPVNDFDFWDAGFNASWELDFWGRYRRAIESKDALLNAEIENYDNVLVILQAEVARAYIQYRTLQERLEVARNNTALQNRTLEIADVRFRNGRATELDVAQAKENLAVTKSLIPQLESSIRQTGNALCVLLGEPPRDLNSELGVKPIPQAPAQVIAGIPADLLRRRPDVRRAERLAAAQSAAIGVAESDFYPRIAVTGYIGLESEDFAKLFSEQSVIGSIGPGFRWNILNYGRIRNNVRANEAKFYELVLEYQSTVLAANQEVEDGLVALLKERERAEALKESSEWARRSVEISSTQWDNGKINFLPVVYTQQIQATREDQYASSRGAVALNMVSLYKALGGGWQTRMASQSPVQNEAPLPLPPVAPLPPTEPAPQAAPALPPVP